MLFADFTISYAISEINSNAKSKPEDKLNPGDERQAEHLGDASDDSNKRNPGDEGNFEGAFEFRMRFSQNPNSKTYDGENKERRHRHQLPQNID